MKSKIIWKDNMAFYGEGENSTNQVVFDATSGVGGNEEGPCPMEMLLISLAGCASMDIMTIIRKRRKEIEEYWVEVSGERRDEHPKIFEKIDMTFHVKSKDLTEKELVRAIELSESTYCSVWSSFDPDKTEITYDYVIHPPAEE
ncbi:OsmC family protein [Natranaerobius thermophilus]|uniref:OsmC family protein n=1 Tax=Natranaerobius thermophilus (strain ATCC BAA-1301 / DSM 18059 / JW/NM-WN-LF) TaxID=457570 RepID=B2A1K6_NATTJ|nr:OsmC family protein [Natranaerobius thermophilus]ACB84746.1 OsmC family protein [Natranaerobius thermophilus JW/NM-WN-LF]